MKPRKMVTLSPRLDGELESYVAAAKAESRQIFTTAAVIGAIGLASLSIAPALHAEIVYTPANQSVGKSGFNRGYYSTLPVDLNHDGIPDFALYAFNTNSFSSGIRAFHSLEAQRLGSNGILQNNERLALADATGQVIGPMINARSEFGPSCLMAASRFSLGEFGTSFRSSNGLWLNATNRYLGIKFYIDGEIHYGWARLNASPGHATLTGYAYETEPNKPIRAGVFETAPEESSAPAQREMLGALAMGATKIR
jgi:hypothetical protein